MKYFYPGNRHEPVPPGHSICGCCGARYGGDKATAVNNPTGIKVFKGKVGEESKGVNTVKHLQTRNGVVTVALQTKWADK